MLGNYEVKRIGRSRFRYVEAGEGEPLVLLHGLLGTLSNFVEVIEHFKTKYRVIFLLLPLFEGNLLHASVGSMKKFVHRFVQKMGFDRVHLVGNSLGGHIALLYALDPKSVLTVKTLTLTGSSGLFEHGMGDTYPKRGNYEYIRMKAQSTFFDPAVATKELVDEVFETVNNRAKALRIVYLARSATRNYLGDRLHDIHVPTLLIWGKNDNVTPPVVAEEFNRKIAGSQLCFIDECGHAPMMERPREFNAILEPFLQRHR